MAEQQWEDDIVALPDRRPSQGMQAGDPEEGTLWEHVRPRQIDDATWGRFEGHVSEIFSAFGMDLDTPGTVNTPRRFLLALFDWVIDMAE